MKDIVDSLGAFPILQFGIVALIALIAVPVAMRALKDRGASQATSSSSDVSDLLLQQSLMRIEKMCRSILRKLGKK